MERKIKQKARYKRHKRVRAKIFGTAARPRLCVFRSNKHIWTQLIDDEKKKTILSSSDLELKKSKIQISKSKTKSESKIPKIENKEPIRTGKIEIAYKVGKLIGKKALEKKIEKVVFDRGGYKYHGRIKALTEGARSAGLKF